MGQICADRGPLPTHILFKPESACRWFIKHGGCLFEGAGFIVLAKQRGSRSPRISNQSGFWFGFQDLKTFGSASFSWPSQPAHVTAMKAQELCKSTGPGIQKPFVSFVDTPSAVQMQRCGLQVPMKKALRSACLSPGFRFSTQFLSIQVTLART